MAREMHALYLPEATDESQNRGSTDLFTTSSGSTATPRLNRSK